MNMGNDLLFYESRKRAIERVRDMQEKAEKAVFEEKNQQGTKKDNETNVNFQDSRPYCSNPPGMNYNPDSMGNNKKTFSSLLEGIFKGNKDNLGFLKNQLGEITGPLKGIMDYFDLDSEKLIIIMIMWVLFNEKSDKTLLLALGYLLL